ncbi:hypothetical protein VNI00_016127 [Paramarasmius palmivorus]|uniref:F-box domain-containing protein n=1 Tax=Paramarasmius palmivorus TaxID=297713 RepID=A0AAW0BDX6_9AGAR
MDSSTSDKHFALVCRQWFSVYVRIRWHTIKDPAHLLSATCNFSLNNDSIRRFREIYAHRIHGINFDEHLVDPFALEWVLYALSTIPHALSLFLPNVTSLRLVNLTQASSSQRLSALVNHQITDFRILDDLQDTRNVYRSAEFEDSLEQLLVSIPQSMPQLRRLEITVPLPRRVTDLYATITQSLYDLETLRLPCSAYLPAFDLFIASLNIRSLAFGAPAEVVRDARHFTSSEYIFVPVTLLPDSFHGLTSVELQCCTHVVATQFFRSMSNKSLRSIVLSIPAGTLAPNPPSPAEMKQLHFAISESYLTLEEIVLEFAVDRNGEEINVLSKLRPELEDMIATSDLLPFSLCSRLKVFSYHHIYPVSIDCSELTSLTACWPNLAELALCPTPFLPYDQLPTGIKRLDWEALHIMSRRRQFLSSLELAIVHPPDHWYSPALLRAIQRSMGRFQNLLCFNPGPYCHLPEQFEQRGPNSIFRLVTSLLDSDLYSSSDAGGMV